jgi:serine/threonine-protein kinase RsbW
MKTEKIYLDSSLINLSTARNFISTKAKEAGADESDITKIEISCDEWCANIIEHALGTEANRGFTVECAEDDGKFVIVYEHEGDRFNPIEQDDINISEHFSESKERGLGIYIMKEMMDEIHYEYVDDSINRLTLVKYVGSD